MEWDNLVMDVVRAQVEALRAERDALRVVLGQLAHIVEGQPGAPAGSLGRWIDDANAVPSVVLPDVVTPGK